MRLSTVVLAVLPAFAMADSVSSAPSMTTVTDHSKTTITTTCTDTAFLTKTVTLSRVHTTVSTLNSTAVIQPTGGITHPASTPTTLPSPSNKGPSNAAGALDAGKVAFAGVAGMVVAALL
ncbi:hypothetical protein NLG97_g7590 [Lecanicillium saksenae]|uniref:Uncharacterized protein n=1 Tax=Lecanicillium saksenae TaxID=468837 RepID=A0ACC1QNQ2_9HYPO|nr:hypothetical protein NLG97_g7590 [Lecanicillium saksenae]